MKKTLTMIVLLGLMATVAMAATDTATDSFTIDVAEIAVIDIAGTAANFTITAPGTGGAQPVITPPSTSATYAQYTSVVDVAGNHRTVTAGISTTEVPLGLNLNLEASTPSPGVGDLGTGVGGGVDWDYNTATAGTIIQDIGSCATGTGATDGANLTYTVTIVQADFDDLVTTATSTVTVTFTLTDDV